MRWCYKTVHYDLKKAGFLGSSFLDEAEVEQSLNEYGQSGWELVSITETQDGLIAIFKQPLDPVEEPVRLGRAIREDDPFESDVDEIITEKDIITEDVFEEDLLEETERKDEDVSKKDDDNGLHSIRIE
ncbi:DUF4177 domain-containing protein [Desulfopila inferna]|uniref:DUF4177 domain-containing protein n=1 Tax=Desulfopila inferna TaxID=468528 RepID=UPI001964E03E|nr:DUF4177 domain-containing protein [Desulfopila inferna]MBM9605848.1 DUF4177 domain-containing protein [Desulfopila inferna]